MHAQSAEFRVYAGISDAKKRTVLSVILLFGGGGLVFLGAIVAHSLRSTA